MTYLPLARESGRRDGGEQCEYQCDIDQAPLIEYQTQQQQYPHPRGADQLCRQHTITCAWAVEYAQQSEQQTEHQDQYGQ